MYSFGSLMGLSLNMEILTLAVLGIVYTSMDTSIFDLHSNLKQVWSTPLFPASDGIQNWLRALITTIVTVRSCTTHLHLACYVIMLYPVLSSERPSLLLPWLVVCAIKHLCMSILSLGTGLYLCAVVSHVRPACLYFVAAKLVELAPAVYMWSLVYCLYKNITLEGQDDNSGRFMSSAQVLEQSTRRRKARRLEIPDGSVHKKSSSVSSTLAASRPYSMSRSLDTLISSHLTLHPALERLTTADKTLRHLGLSDHRDIAAARLSCSTHPSRGFPPTREFIVGPIASVFQPPEQFCDLSFLDRPRRRLARSGSRRNSSTAVGIVREVRSGMINWTHTKHSEVTLEIDNEPTVVPDMPRTVSRHDTDNADLTDVRELPIVVGAGNAKTVLTHSTLMQYLILNYKKEKLKYALTKSLLLLQESTAKGFQISSDYTTVQASAAMFKMNLVEEDHQRQRNPFANNNRKVHTTETQDEDVPRPSGVEEDSESDWGSDDWEYEGSDVSSLTGYPNKKRKRVDKNKTQEEDIELTVSNEVLSPPHEFPDVTLALRGSESSNAVFHYMGKSKPPKKVKMKAAAHSTDNTDNKTETGQGMELRLVIRKVGGTKTQETRPIQRKKSFKEQASKLMKSMSSSNDIWTTDSYITITKRPSNQSDYRSETVSISSARQSAASGIYELTDKNEPKSSRVQFSFTNIPREISVANNLPEEQEQTIRLKRSISEELIPSSGTENMIPTYETLLKVHEFKDSTLNDKEYVGSFADESIPVSVTHNQTEIEIQSVPKSVTEFGPQQDENQMAPQTIALNSSESDESEDDVNDNNSPESKSQHLIPYGDEVENDHVQQGEENSNVKLETQHTDITENESKLKHIKQQGANLEGHLKTSHSKHIENQEKEEANLDEHLESQRIQLFKKEAEVIRIKQEDEGSEENLETEYIGINTDLRDIGQEGVNLEEDSVHIANGAALKHIVKEEESSGKDSAMQSIELIDKEADLKNIEREEPNSEIQYTEPIKNRQKGEAKLEEDFETQCSELIDNEIDLKLIKQEEEYLEKDLESRDSESIDNEADLGHIERVEEDSKDDLKTHLTEPVCSKNRVIPTSKHCSRIPKHFEDTQEIISPPPTKKKCTKDLENNDTKNQRCKHAPKISSNESHHQCDDKPVCLCMELKTSFQESQQSSKSVLSNVCPKHKKQTNPETQPITARRPTSITFSIGESDDTMIHKSSSINPCIIHSKCNKKYTKQSKSRTLNSKKTMAVIPEVSKMANELVLKHQNTKASEVMPSHEIMKSHIRAIEPSFSSVEIDAISADVSINNKMDKYNHKWENGQSNISCSKNVPSTSTYIVETNFQIKKNMDINNLKTHLQRSTNQHKMQSNDNLPDVSKIPRILHYGTSHVKMKNRNDYCGESSEFENICLDKENILNYLDDIKETHRPKSSNNTSTVLANIKYAPAKESKQTVSEHKCCKYRFRHDERHAMNKMARLDPPVYSVKKSPGTTDTTKEFKLVKDVCCKSGRTVTCKDSPSATLPWNACPHLDLNKNCTANIIKDRDAHKQKIHCKESSSFGKKIPSRSGLRRKLLSKTSFDGKENNRSLKTASVRSNPNSVTPNERVQTVGQASTLSMKCYKKNLQPFNLYDEVSFKTNSKSLTRCRKDIVLNVTKRRTARTTSATQTCKKFINPNRDGD